MDNSDNPPDQQADEAQRLRELEVENAKLKKAIATHDEHLVAKGCSHLALEFCQAALVCVAILVGIGFIWFVVSLLLQPETWDNESIGYLVGGLLCWLVPFGLTIALLALVAHLVRKHYRISKK